MEHPETNPPLPGEYYRKHAAWLLRLAGEATTPAIRGHLRDEAAKYERLAERVVLPAQAEDDPKG